MQSAEEYQLELRYTAEDVTELLVEIQRITEIKFIVLQKQKYFGNPEWQPNHKGRVYWEHPSIEPDLNIPIQFDGHPFMFVGRKVMGCHQGIDKNKEKRLKYDKQKKMNADHGFLIKHRKPRTSKKVNCPAQIYTLQIAKFLDYEIQQNTTKDRRDISKQLRNDLQFGKTVAFNMIYMTRIPKLTDHKGHMVNGQIYEPEPPKRPPKRQSNAKALIKKCTEVTQTINEATCSLTDEPYLQELLMTLENLQSSVIAHTSNSDSESNGPLAKRQKVEIGREVTIEIETGDEFTLQESIWSST